MVTLQLFDTESWKMRVTLDNVSYIFQFDYNSSSDFWIMSLSSGEDVAIVSGIKLVIGLNLFQPYGSRDVPKGALLCVDTTGELTRIGRDDIPDNISLVYATVEEINAAIEE